MARKVTVVLDDDVAARLDEESKRAGGSLDEAVNDLVRRSQPVEPQLFRVRAHSLGPPRIDLNCTARALEEQDRMEKK
jgi:hypothetical protein